MNLCSLPRGEFHLHGVSSTGPLYTDIHVEKMLPVTIVQFVIKAQQLRYTIGKVVEVLLFGHCPLHFAGRSQAR